MDTAQHISVAVDGQTETPLEPHSLEVNALAVAHENVGAHTPMTHRARETSRDDITKHTLVRERGLVVLGSYCRVSF